MIGEIDQKTASVAFFHVLYHTCLISLQTKDINSEELDHEKILKVFFSAYIIIVT